MEQWGQCFSILAFKFVAFFISSALGNGLNLNGNSIGHITNSSIQSTYSDQWGGNAVDISHGSEIYFNYDDRHSTNLITIVRPLHFH